MAQHASPSTSARSDGSQATLKRRKNASDKVRPSDEQSVNGDLSGITVKLRSHEDGIKIDAVGP